MKNRVKCICIYVILNAIILCGCNGNLKDNAEKNKVDRKGSFYFDDVEYEAVDTNFNKEIIYKQPNIECKNGKYIKVYKSDTQILFIWLGEKADYYSSKDVLNKNSKEITKYICLYTNIENVDVNFNLDMIAQDRVNNIARNKYKGIIEGIGNNGVDISFNTVIYTFVVNDKPGCVVGIIKDKNNDIKRYREIDNNTQIIVNSMREYKE